MPGAHPERPLALRFRLAHLSDPHVGPLGRPRFSQLLGKRATGYANWRRGRSRSHDMAVLSLLVADLKAQCADHVACTGDLCNIGLPSEWETARSFMDALGSPDSVSLVPGNHDAYVRAPSKGCSRPAAPIPATTQERPAASPTCGGGARSL